VKSWVYFARYGLEGPIKIGRADDPRRRVGDLNVATPVQLILLGALLSEQADIEEVEIQRRLGAYRVKGEWFDATAALAEMDRQATRLVSPDQVQAVQFESAWARSVNLNIRVQPDEITRWRIAAREQNKPLSAWVRDVLNPFAEEVADTFVILGPRSNT
jgi:hypothetical protein